MSKRLGYERQDPDVDLAFCPSPERGHRCRRRSSRDHATVYPRCRKSVFPSSVFSASSRNVAIRSSRYCRSTICAWKSIFMDSGSRPLELSEGRFRTAYLFQSASSGAADLDVLIAITAADADGAHKLASNDDRRPTGHGAYAGKRQEERMAALDSIVKGFRRPTISGGRPCLLLRELDCGVGRAIHFDEIDEVARRLDYGNGVRNLYLFGCRQGRVRCLAGLLVSYRSAEWRRRGGEGEGC